jgi:uncharacterized protein (DUF3820 family)
MDMPKVTYGQLKPSDIGERLGQRAILAGLMKFYMAAFEHDDFPQAKILAEMKRTMSMGIEGVDIRGYDLPAGGDIVLFEELIRQSALAYVADVCAMVVI